MMLDCLRQHNQHSSERFKKSKISQNEQDSTITSTMYVVKVDGPYGTFKPGLIRA